jgi:di/tricarboxylate transporter
MDVGDPGGDGVAMGLAGWEALGVTVLILVVLAREWAPADVTLLAGTVFLALLRVITPDQALAGFANSGVMTVAALLIVAAALRETGVLDYVGHRVLGRVQTEQGVLIRLAILVLGGSAFLNNTPIVAMLLPIVIDWCRRRQVSPSKLLIPLSFLTILHGGCTLIGTSTNLVVQGLLKTANASGPFKGKLPPMGLFEIGYVGIPCAIVGTLYVMSIGRRLLPDRKELIEQLGEARREYLLEMLVQPGCRLIGQTVEAAGLRQLPGLFLIEIDREGTLIAPVEPTEVFRAHDRLVFTGVVSTIVDLEKIPGLVPAADASYEVTPKGRRGRLLCEAVISRSSPLEGQAIRDADFRALYNAAVVAVHRDGARLTNKVGDVVLRAGDTLLLQVGPHFARAFRNKPDFYLVSDVEDSRPLRHDRAGVSVAIFVLMIALLSSNRIDTVLVAFLAAGLMVATRCISITEARKAVEWPLLVAISAAFGISAALENSGAAATLSHGLVDLTRALGPRATLAALYFGTMVLNEMITNNAAAAMAFPLAVESAATLGVAPRPFVMAITLAASFAFASPIGYQTHMMVYGPGGYRFADFVKVGLPLNLLLWGLATLLIPLVWPF